MGTVSPDPPAADAWELLNRRGYPRVTLADGRVVEGSAGWVAHLAGMTAAERLAAVQGIGEERIGIMH